MDEQPTDDDLLCMYLTMFGTETLDKAELQEGEAEFLIAWSEKLALSSGQSVWGRIYNAKLARRNSSSG